MRCCLKVVTCDDSIRAFMISANHVSCQGYIMAHLLEFLPAFLSVTIREGQCLPLLPLLCWMRLWCDHMASHLRSITSIQIKTKDSPVSTRRNLFCLPVKIVAMYQYPDISILTKCTWMRCIQVHVDITSATSYMQFAFSEWRKHQVMDALTFVAISIAMVFVFRILDPFCSRIGDAPARRVHKHTKLLNNVPVK